MTSRLTSAVTEGVEKVYAAAELWVERALRADDSLFTPGTPIWTLSGLRELRERFLDRPDEGDRGFLAKLREQLEGSPPEVYQLMAEVLYVNFLIISQGRMKAQTKRNQINNVLGWGAPILTVPEAVSESLAPGIAGIRPLVQNRHESVGFIIEFAEHWKELQPHEQQARLDDPWSFKEFVTGFGFRSRFLLDSQNTANAQMRAVLHLVHPDTFERILSDEHRRKYLDKYARLVTSETTDEDRKFRQIRTVLEAEHGEDFDFHEHELNAPGDDDDAPGEDDPAEDASEPSAPDLAGLARKLFLTEPDDFLHRIEKLLADKRQVIFQGPPGTGKTFVAQALAQNLAGSDDRVTLVQMHPSYAYEDFVQGFRPTLQGGQAGFELRDGPLAQAAEQARAEPDAKHFLIIDEINRGNVAKVFGELYFLLEYRDRGIRLQYQSDGEADFSLPPNLYFIGTMNTADRSIALVDSALRRRFYFVEFHPDAEPIKGLLRRWLTAHAPEMGWVADVVGQANKLLGDDRHAAIGPSHFMKSGLNAEAVERIWTHSVLPYVEECLYGQHDRLSEFDLDALRKSDGPGTPQADGEPPDEHAPTRADGGPPVEQATQARDDPGDGSVAER
ncbi:MAG: AAA family ATPase [bacterium]|nr:AAA family ATPase [bacterium]